MLDPDGVPGEAQLRPRRRSRATRSCAAIDHPAARQQTFNVCMDEPVDYGELGAYLHETRGLPPVGDRARRTTRPGSTTPRRSSCSAGGRGTI